MRRLCNAGSIKLPHLTSMHFFSMAVSIKELELGEDVHFYVLNDKSMRLLLQNNSRSFPARGARETAPGKCPLCWFFVVARAHRGDCLGWEGIVLDGRLTSSTKRGHVGALWSRLSWKYHCWSPSTRWYNVSQAFSLWKNCSQRFN